MTNEQQKAFNKMISKHPQIGARLFELCNLVENSSGEFTTADAAEEFLIKEIRKLGQEVLQGWATNQSEKLTTDSANNVGAVRHSKKKFTGKQRMES